MKKKNEVEIQSKGIEQQADGKYKLVETHNGHVTLLNFNFSQLMAIFAEKYRVFSNHAARKSHKPLLKSKTKVITSRYW